MLVPRMSVKLSGLYASVTTGSRTVMFTVAEETPPELLAHTVNIVVVRLTVGVPAMTPLEKVKPNGNEGWMDQVSTAPPE